jgi:uncharacterized membrane protein
MAIFAFIGIYLMPLLGFLFIIFLFRGIKKIVKNRPYTTEVFWCGFCFTLIVWTICVLVLK